MSVLAIPVGTVPAEKSATVVSVTPAPPVGVLVAVGVAVGMDGAVGVDVGVKVAVGVGVTVAVGVGVLVGVAVPVAVGVAVGLGAARAPGGSPEPASMLNASSSSTVIAAITARNSHRELAGLDIGPPIYRRSEAHKIEAGLQSR